MGKSWIAPFFNLSMIYLVLFSYLLILVIWSPVNLQWWACNSWHSSFNSSAWVHWKTTMGNLPTGRPTLKYIEAKMKYGLFIQWRKIWKKKVGWVWLCQRWPKMTDFEKFRTILCLIKYLRGATTEITWI